MIFSAIIALFLIFLNGFFVAAEFAIVKVRQSQIKIRAKQGSNAARISERIIKQLDTYLSATQLGITLASLGLGWIGEPVIAKMISQLLGTLDLSMKASTLHTTSFITGFILITILHIVLGELAPKSIAINKSEATALFVAYPLHFFYIIFRPFILLMNTMAIILLRLIGIKPAGEQDIHSAEELMLLVRESKDSGFIREDNYRIIKNAFDFSDVTARHVMIPRLKMFALDIDSPIDEIKEKIIETGYSRIPVYKDTLDNIVGIVYAREVFQKSYTNPKFNIKDLFHEVTYVVKSKKISDILKLFQKKQIHMAVVIDEYGGTDGIITLEDILEELVGEIRDEDDDEKSIVEKKGKNIFIVQSTNSLNDINDYLPHPLETSEDYNTLSGLILYKFNGIPEINDKITINNYEITVLNVKNRMVQTVQLKNIDQDNID